MKKISSSKLINKRYFTKNLGLLFAAIIFGLILSEFILRVFVCFKAGDLKLLLSATVANDNIEQPSSYRNHALISGISFTATGRPPGFEYVTYGKISSQGLNNGEIPQKKLAGEKRVLVLGDSFVEARQVPREKNFCSLLEKRFSTERLFRIQVINAGISSYSPLLEYLYFKQELQFLQPDIVILMFFANDVYDDMRYTKNAKFDEHRIPVTVGPGTQWLVLPRKGGAKEMKRFIEYKLMLLSGPRKTWASRKFYLAAILEHLVFVLRLNRDFPKPPENDDFFILKDAQPLKGAQGEGWRLTQRYIELLKEECDIIKAKMLLTSVPIAAQIYGSAFDNYFFFRGRPTDANHLNIQRIAREMGVPYMDLVIPLKQYGEGIFFPQDGHFTPKGHQIVAEAMHKRLNSLFFQNENLKKLSEQSE